MTNQQIAQEVIRRHRERRKVAPTERQIFLIAKRGIETTIKHLPELREFEARMMKAELVRRAAEKQQ